VFRAKPIENDRSLFTDSAIETLLNLVPQEFELFFLLFLMALQGANSALQGRGLVGITTLGNLLREKSMGFVVELNRDGCHQVFSGLRILRS
jgi:hypothetical protein